MDTIENVFYYFSKLNSVKKKKLSSNLFRAKYSEISGLPNYRDSSKETIVHQLFYCCTVIDSYSGELNEYLKYKHQFELGILQSDFALCQNCLEKIEKCVSVSIWSLQNELLLSQMTDGLEGNKKKLKSLQNCGLDTNTDILLGLYSFCLEDKVTTDGFEYALNEKFVKWGEKYLEICSYFEFILDRSNFNSIEQIPSILKISCSNSIIDLYEDTLITLILFFSKYQDDLINRKIKNLIQKISTKLNDDRWCLLANYLNPENIHSTQIHKSTILPFLDLYSKDNYAEILSLGKKLINKFPVYLDFYDIYCKAIISSNLSTEEVNGYLKITKNKSLINEIAIDYYNTLSKTDKTSSALLRMQKRAKILSTLPFSEQLYTFCSQHSVVKNKKILAYIKNKGLINSFGGTPKFANIYNKKELKKLFISGFKKKYGDEHSLKPYEFFDSNICLEKKLTDREKIYLSKIYFMDGEYSKVINLLEKSIELDFVCFYKERIIKLLLQSYQGVNECENQLNLLAKIIVENKHLLHTVDIQGFFIRMKDKSIHDFDLALDRAILVDYYLRNSPEGKVDNTDRYNAYSSFLELLEIEIPSELFSNKSEMEKFDLNRLMYFFRFICSFETLEDDWHFNNNIEREKERIKICDYLIYIDSQNLKFYQAEILEISRNAEIRKFLRKIDRSRIFVETKRIIDTLNENFKEKCDRLLSLINLPQELRQVKEFVEGDNTQENKIDYHDVGYQIFQYLFLELVELFILHDEYGLDSFLSGRIRHGVLDTEIRSVFEMNNLVTKSEDGQYVRNDFWLTEESELDLLNTFNELSKTVDEKLAFVIQKWIQVSTKNDVKIIKPKEGMYIFYSDKKVFDFSFHRDELEKFYKELEEIQDIQNVTEFCEFVFEFLWARAKICLKNMRELIKNKLENEFLYSIEIFEKKALKHETIDKERLITKIHNCRGQLNRKLEEVSNWFRLSKILTYEDYMLENLLNSCVSIFNNRNAMKFLTSNIDCNENRFYHARTFLPLIEILLIKLGNVVKHAQSKIDTTIINAQIDNGILTISIQNELSEEDLHRKDLKDGIENALKTYDPSAIRREGRSGFHKINNIIRNHFDPDETLFHCRIKQDRFFYSKIEIPERDLLA